MVTLQNDKLKIRVKKIGAELCEISAVKNGIRFMWDANPEIWPNFAPNLFPIVGMLKDETYFYEGKSYQLSKHGFIRNNTNFQIVEESNESISLKLKFDDASLKAYPFKFEYIVKYRLDDTKIHITYQVINKDLNPMYFSIGAHPAFKCPVFKDEVYSDYQLVFNKNETSQTHLLNLESGLVTSEKKTVFDKPNSIQLHPELFNHDALIFKDLKSRNVTLNSKSNGDILTVHFKDFPYLGLWAKPNANYVCIEPWLGIADSEHTNQQLIDKEGILKLEANKEYSAAYSIEIHKAHLV